jgi:hypothetical protein
MTLVVTTTIVSAQVFGLMPEPDVFALLYAGWWNVAALHQPDYDPDRPLVPRLGMATTAASGGGVVYMGARIDGEGATDADARILHPGPRIAAA